MIKVLEKILLSVIIFFCIPVDAMMTRVAAGSRLVSNMVVQSAGNAVRTLPTGNKMGEIKSPKQYYHTNNQKQYTHNNQSKNNYSHLWAYGAAVVAAACAACVGEQVVQCQAQELQAYVSPWERARAAYYARLRAKSWGAVSDTNIKSLASEQQALDNKLFAMFNITAKEWHVFKDKHLEEFIALTRAEVAEVPKIKLCPQVERCVKEVCAEIDFDFNKIHLVLTDKDMIMSTKQFTLIINPNLCDKLGALNNDKFKAQVIHEIQHFLHDDHFDKYCMKKLYQERNGKVTQQDFDAFAKDVSYFKERRADILATLSELKYAAAAEQGYEMFAKPPFWMWALGLFYDLNTVLAKTHPPFTSRYEYIKRTAEQMHKAK